jgi:hypothetical protein
MIVVGGAVVVVVAWVLVVVVVVGGAGGAVVVVATDWVVVVVGGALVVVVVVVAVGDSLVVVVVVVAAAVETDREGVVVVVFGVGGTGSRRLAADCGSVLTFALEPRVASSFSPNNEFTAAAPCFLGAAAVDGGLEAMVVVEVAGAVRGAGAGAVDRSGPLCEPSVSVCMNPT